MKYLIVHDKERKKILARSILEALPDWFGIEEAREGFKEFEVCRLYGMKGIPVRFM